MPSRRAGRAEKHQPGSSGDESGSAMVEPNRLGDVGESPELSHDQQMPAVLVEGVGKVYEPSPPMMRVLLRSSIKSPVTALTDIDLRMHPGEIVAVVGPNGAGKSTLFRILTGLTTPTTGQASVCGFDVTTESHRVRRLVGFAPAQEYTLLLRHTCAENLRFHGQLHGMTGASLESRIAETLEFVGLTAARDRVGFALSSGMKARLQLARAVLHRPQVLILDEPTANVDPIAGYGMLQVIQTLAREDNMAVLISSHRLEEIEALHDRVLLVNQGKVVYEGDLDELRRKWQQPQVRIGFNNLSAANAAARRLGATPDIEVVAVAKDHVIVATHLGPGRVISGLNGRLEDVTEVAAVTIPLMDLLARILGTGGVE